MANIRPDDVILSSETQGFGYIDILTTTIAISGAIPDGGKDFTGSIVTDANTLNLGFYKVSGSSIFGSTDLSEISNTYSGVDGADGMTTYILGNQNTTSYDITVRINNYSGAPQVVPTQTVTILIYEFESPFN